VVVPPFWGILTGGNLLVSALLSHRFADLEQKSANLWLKKILLLCPMTHPTFTSHCKPFGDLTPYELYAIMRLRNEVFVVEQNCVYQDADGKDPHCHHLTIWENDTLVAYARLLPKSLSFEQMSIGRVISSPAYRKTGAGKLLIGLAINACGELFGDGPIRIGAQLYLQKFYESFGFVQTSDVYLEDNIQHIEMIREQFSV
jgi:ElaA protein